MVIFHIAILNYYYPPRFFAKNVTYDLSQSFDLLLGLGSSLSLVLGVSEKAIYFSRGEAPPYA